MCGGGGVLAIRYDLCVYAHTTATLLCMLGTRLDAAEGAGGHTNMIFNAPNVTTRQPEPGSAGRCYVMVIMFDRRGCRVVVVVVGSVLVVVGRFSGA